jgi:hypothetical protein
MINMLHLTMLQLLALFSGNKSSNKKALNIVYMDIKKTWHTSTIQKIL